MVSLVRTIDGIEYDVSEALWLDTFCLGYTENGVLWQDICVTVDRSFFLFIYEIPENTELSIPVLKQVVKDFEIVAITAEQAIERYESKYWEKDTGRFDMYAKESIEEFIEESKCDQ